MAITPPMNPEIKALWVQWLRDNADKQGYTTLKRDGKFCCLGGLCELAVGAGVAHSAPFGAIWHYGPTVPGPSSNWSEAVLPSVVSQWAGLGDVEAPVVRYQRAGDLDNECPYSLVTLNDDDQLNFNQIADLIEQQL